MDSLKPTLRSYVNSATGRGKFISICGLETLEAMPTSRHALKKLLDVTEQQIGQAESRLMKATSDEERERLVETLADPHISQKVIMDPLTEDGHV